MSLLNIATYPAHVPPSTGWLSLLKLQVSNIIARRTLLRALKTKILPGLTCTACCTNCTRPSFRWIKLTPIFFRISKCSGLLAMKSLALNGGFGPLPKLSSLPKDIRDQSFKTRLSLKQNSSVIPAITRLEFLVHRVQASVERNFSFKLSFFKVVYIINNFIVQNLIPNIDNKTVIFSLICK